MVGTDVNLDHPSDVIHEGLEYEPPVDTPSVIPYPETVVGLPVNELKVGVAAEIAELKTKIGN